jgi:hypothetical protein
MTLTERFPQLRSRGVRYALALVLVGGSSVWFFLAAHVLASPYLVSFMAAVALSSLLGIGPGCVAWVAATLASDFFFTPPIFDLNFDRFTWLAAANYALALLFGRAGAQLVRHRIGQALLFEKFVLGLNGKPFVGRIDGALEGELYGWAVDRNVPSLPPRITVYANTQPIGDVLPVWYRPDVGQHSFYFDLSLVCPAGSHPLVEARFQDGARLSHCPLKVRIPDGPGKCHSDAILFMHIAKAAGTAFREAIVGNYKQSQIAYLYSHVPGFPISDLGALPLEQRANFRLVIGHFHYGIHAFFPQKTVYVTVVRDPIRRVISHFQFLLQTEIAAPKDMNLPELLLKMLETHATTQLDNMMVRCFAGVLEANVPAGAVDRNIYDRAVYNLHRSFRFVGHQEWADDAYANLHNQFGWTARKSLAALNRGERINDQAFDAVRPAIEHFNRWDCQLYSEICRTFPPPPSSLPTR